MGALPGDCPGPENIPLILETPDDTLWPEETKRLLDA